MADGATSKGGVESENFWRIPDRGAAISFALLKAQPGDIVMLLGKGHEQSMNFEGIEYPWDDRIALLAALAKQLGKEGPEMPYLPSQQS
jgi:UDP-N-acetylmuramoyl-L-alanyl-D-glutamate--2,6-diaminopimelate ligase